MPANTASFWKRLLTAETLLVGLTTYLALKISGAVDLLAGVCTGCWVANAGAPDAVAAATAAGTSVGEKVVKDIIDKKAGGPLTSFKDMYDIASQDTPEGQAEQAWKVYKNTIMTEHAPPGSLGHEINEAIDKFFEFSKDADLDR